MHRRLLGQAAETGATNIFKGLYQQSEIMSLMKFARRHLQGDTGYPFQTMKTDVRTKSETTSHNILSEKLHFKKQQQNIPSVALQ